MWETGLICLQCARSTFNSGLELLEGFAHPAFLAPQTTDEDDGWESHPPAEGTGYVEPTEEDAKELNKLQKAVLGSSLYNGDVSDKPKTYTDSRKLQLSTPEGFYELLNLWACAEGRDVSSVAAVAMEAGLRSLMADGAIPKVALEIYEKRSRERVAKAEARAAIADFINDAEGGPF